MAVMMKSCTIEHSDFTRQCGNRYEEVAAFVSALPQFIAKIIIKIIVAFICLEQNVRLTYILIKKLTRRNLTCCTFPRFGRSKAIIPVQIYKTCSMPRKLVRQQFRSRCTVCSLAVRGSSGVVSLKKQGRRSICRQTQQISDTGYYRCLKF